MNISKQFVHFNFKEIEEGVYFVSNDYFRWLLLAQDEFSKLLVGDVSQDSNPELYNILYQNFFIIDENNFDVASDYMLRLKPIHSKNSCTFVLKLTNFCNYNCIYCQASSDVMNGKCVMTKETAKNAVDFIFKTECDYIVFEFQGGEPLSNFPVIQYIVDYANSKSDGRKLNFRMMTNLSLITDEMISWLTAHHVSFGTSLDGPKKLTDKSRVLKDGTGVFDITNNKRKYVEGKVGYPIGLISTIPKSSLEYPKEYVDFYIEENQPFLIRPLFKLGKADTIWNEIGYTAEDFLTFYEEVLQYTLDYNKSHPNTNVYERRTALFAERILFNTQHDIEITSPCGSILNMVSVDYNGDILACEGAKMINGAARNHFILGNVNDDSVKVFFSRHTHSLLKNNISESDPYCSRCAYLPYCGQCAVERYTSEQSHLFNCKINEGMLNIILKKLYNANDGESEILQRWADFSRHHLF